MKFDNVLSGFLILVVLTLTLITINNGFVERYDLVETDTKYNEETGQYENVAEALESLNLIDGTQTLYTSILNITSPTNIFDVVGSLLAAGIGAVKVMTGVVSFPAGILGVIISYYTGLIPYELVSVIELLFGIYVIFILLRYYTRTE